MASEIVFLREEVRRLTDRLLAVTHPQAFQAIQFPPIRAEDCYGSDSDEMIDYDPITGAKILVVKKKQ